MTEQASNSGTQQQTGDAAAAAAAAGEGQQQNAGQNADQQGQQAKGSEGKPQGAPEQYQAFKLPEGATLESEALTELQSFAKSLNLTQEQAQALVDRDIKTRADFSAAQKAQHEGLLEKWLNDSKTDKEFGGDKFDENLAVALKARDAFATPELKKLLNETGMGNHPEVVRFFLKIGKAISEDGFVRDAGTTGAMAKTVEERLYGKTN